MEKEEKIIELIGVEKEFDGEQAVENMNLYVRKGEFITILGPSGCGKSTTLRMIAGFELPTKGKILLNGKDITNLPPYERPINTVFQRYALFPHLNVYDNIAFGLKLKRFKNTYKTNDGKIITKVEKLTKDVIDAKVSKVLKLVDLEEFGFVLAGTVIVHLGNKKYKVNKGESFYYSASKEHYIENNTDRVAKFIWVATPPTF